MSNPAKNRAPPPQGDRAILNVKPTRNKAKDPRDLDRFADWMGNRIAAGVDARPRDHWRPDAAFLYAAKSSMALMCARSARKSATKAMPCETSNEC